MTVIDGCGDVVGSGTTGCQYRERQLYDALPPHPSRNCDNHGFIPSADPFSSRRLDTRFGCFS